jgi:hypothetical protein
MFSRTADSARYRGFSLHTNEENPCVSISLRESFNSAVLRCDGDVKTLSGEEETMIGTGIIEYSKDLDIRNLESVPSGTGMPYLECVPGVDGALVAKQWRRSPVYRDGNVLVSFCMPNREHNFHKAVVESATRTEADCWQCGKRMSSTHRQVTPFCSIQCEYDYNKVGF